MLDTPIKVFSFFRLNIAIVYGIWNNPQFITQCCADQGSIVHSAYLTICDPWPKNTSGTDREPTIYANLAILATAWVFYWSPGVCLGP